MDTSGQGLLSIYLPSLVLAGLCLFLVAYSLLKHQRNLINPIAFFVFLDLVAMGLLSAYSSIQGPASFGASAAAISYTLWLHITYGVGVAVGYFTPKNPFQCTFALGLTSLNFSPSGIHIKGAFWFLLLAGALAAFLLLARSDVENLLWITSPREAYISLRTGFGHWWLLYQACVVLCFLIALHVVAHSKHGKGLQLLVVGAAVLMMYFTGSKTAVLLVPIIAAIHHHFYRSKLPFSCLIGLAVATVTLFSILLGPNGELGLFSGVIRYFADYVSVTALAVDLIDFQGHTKGLSALSSLWYFVPRSLFPEKPFEYGATILHGTLFPGSAELGHTPGILPWLVAYMDFGLLGIIAYSVILGSFIRAVYLEFLRTRDLGSFLLMTSFCFVPPLASGSFALYILLAVILWIIFGKLEPNFRNRRQLSDSGTHASFN
ncbi:oligosaccharide repeat unit polymerase [Hydrogenophaga sp. R2]|uniref:oligosaccharide repeat unit polymerase n=1 Tax=Hydrogenophaga sp. R2 TaxID=3132827 RepID=UPI003CF2AF11